ncbi:MAG: hypothetical protein Tsb006_5070 [Rickettsiaceae bacterium]
MSADQAHKFLKSKTLQIHSRSFWQYNNFAKVFAHGKLYHFGAVQAKVIEQLYIASLTDSPWLCGKELLHKANSRSIALRDLFKSQTNWRQLIESDHRGNYKLRF